MKLYICLVILALSIVSINGNVSSLTYPSDSQTVCVVSLTANSCTTQRNGVYTCPSIISCIDKVPSKSINIQISEGTHDCSQTTPYYLENRELDITIQPLVTGSRPVFQCDFESYFLNLRSSASLDITIHDLVIDCTTDVPNQQRDSYIYIENEKPSITSIVIYNINMMNGIVNSYSQFGGAISTLYSELVIYGSSFTNFTNSAGNGGAIFATSSYSSLYISNTKFSNNKAYYGGSIYFVGGYLSLYSVDMENSTAFYQGGAVYSTSTGVNIFNSSFAQNGAIYGGALRMAVDYINMESNSFVWNSASTNGGAMMVSPQTPFIPSYASNPQYMNFNSFMYNNADESGGAIYTTVPGIYYFNNTDFYSNSASTATDFYVTYIPVEVYNGTFIKSMNTNGKRQPFPSYVNSITVYYYITTEECDPGSQTVLMEGSRRCLHIKYNPYPTPTPDYSSSEYSSESSTSSFSTETSSLSPSSSSNSDEGGNRFMSIILASSIVVLSIIFISIAFYKGSRDL